MFFVGAGWERPQWFEANAALLDRRRSLGSGATRWAARELVADRRRRAPGHPGAASRCSTSRRSPSSGCGARTPLAFLERICANQIDRPWARRLHVDAHRDAAGSGAT